MVPRLIIPRLYTVMACLITGLTVLCPRPAAADAMDRAWSALYRNDFQRAEDLFGRAARGRDAVSQAHAGLALLHEMRGQFDAARAQYLSAARAAAVETPVSPYADLYLRRAMALRSLCGEDEAVVLTLTSLSGEGAPPDLAASAQALLVQELGHQGRLDEMEEAGRALAFADRFLVCGPFDNHAGAGFGEVYPPETEWNPDGEYRGRVREIGWREIPRPTASGYVNLAGLCFPDRNATAYALTFVWADSAQAAQIRLGHAGAVKVWVNGALAVARDRDHSAGFDQVIAGIDLQPGWNPVLIKIGVKTGDWGFRMRFTDTGGRVLRLAWAAMPDPAPDSPPWPSETVASATPQFRTVRDAALDGDPGGVPAFAAPVLKALLLLESRILDEQDTAAVDQVRPLLTEYDGSALVQRVLGLCERDANARRVALEEALRLNPQDLAAARELILSDLERGWLARARTRLDEAMDRHPDSGAIWELRARLFEKEGHAELARQALAQAVARAPRNTDAWRLLATVPSRLQNHETRLEAWRGALAADFTDDAARTAVLEALLRRGASAEAEREAALERRIRPASTAGLLRLARHDRARGDGESAMRRLEAALGVSPDSAALLRLAGEIAHDRGDEDAALTWWRSALLSAPEDHALRDYADHLGEAAESYYTPYRIPADSLAEPERVPAEADAVTLLDQKVVKVLTTGQSSRTVHRVSRILSEAAASRAARETVWYSPDTESVRILTARVTRADGTVYDAPAPRHVTPSWSNAIASRIYGDYRVAVVEFPGVEKGALVDFEYRVDETGENLYADYFGELFTLGSYEPTVLCEYVLIHPVERRLHHRLLDPLPVEGRVLVPEPSRSVSPDGRNEVLHWRFENLPLVKREWLMPPRTETLPYLKISTFEAWAELGRWYANLIRDQFTPDAQVREMAERARTAAGPEPSTRDLVRSVNTIINNEIRYLGFEFGVHGYKPHRASEVCRNRYGDCKDKATLAIALLRELSIDAEIALVRTRDLGDVDYDLPSLGLFNHAIYYVPDLDGGTWLDGTAEFHGHDELPFGDQGVNLLNIAADGAARFRRSPTRPAADNRIAIEGELTLDAEGTARGRIRQSMSGLFNPATRRTYQNEEKVQEELEKSLAAHLPGAMVGGIVHSDFADNEAPQWLEFDVTIPRFAVREAGRMRVRGVFIPSTLSRRYAPLSERQHDLVMTSFPWTRTTDLRLRIPFAHTIADHPETAAVESPHGAMTRSLSRDGGEYHLRHECRLDAERVTAADYAGFREFCLTVDRHEERVLLLGL